MVNVYLQETERDLMRMKKAILADDADLVYRLAHGCAGASLSYGMIAVLPVIREIEIKAKIGNLDDAMVHWAEAQRQFSRIQTFLKVIDDSNPQQKAA